MFNHTVVLDPVQNAQFLHVARLSIMDPECARLAVSFSSIYVFHHLISIFVVAGNSIPFVGYNDTN
jgi:hypothetical protein